MSKDDPNMAADKFDVFISYRRDDSKAACKLAAKLRELGVATWYDKEQIGAGHIFAGEIARAIEKCRIAVVIWSDSNFEADSRLTSEWTAIQQACWRRPDFVICVLKTDDSPTPPFLRSWQNFSCKKESNIEPVARKICEGLSDWSPRWHRDLTTENKDAAELRRFAEIRQLLDCSNPKSVDSNE